MTRFVSVVLQGMLLLVVAAAGVAIFVHLQNADPSAVAATGGGKEASKHTQSTGGSFLSRLALLPGSSSRKSIIAVMIENHESARPYQKGLDHALMVQEYLVEGLISRFIVLFDTKDLPDVIEPVRSLRPYFIDGVLPLTNTIIHAGGSPEALDRVQGSDTIFAYNGLTYPDHFERDEEAAAPHDLYITKEHLQDLVENDPLAVTWPPYEIGSSLTGSSASVIRFNFLNPQHNVRYTYSALAGTYTRLNGDAESELHPRNVVVLHVSILDIGEHGRLTIGLPGEGDMLLFRSGQVFRGTWSKKSQEDPFVFLDEKGKPMRFARGATWLTGLPYLERVSWSSTVQE